MLAGFALLLSIVALASPAAAVKRCPPLAVGLNGQCTCAAFNYGTTPDTNVTLTLYNALSGDLGSCGPLTIQPDRGAHCTEIFDASAGRCGCKVTGEGGTTAVSLMVHQGSENAQAAVNCR
jgi:hypothetical protein